MIYHLDKGGVIEKFKKTAQGFLELNATVAQEGYLDYPRGNVIEREYVSEKVLFDQEHIETTSTAPVTLDHPQEKVTPETWNLSKGMIKDVFINKEDKTLDVKMLVCSQDAIEAIKQGITALSMGYLAEREQIGEHEYNQTKRTCNHIAIVKIGRANKARLHLDSADCVDSNLIEIYERRIIPIRVKSVTL